MNWAQATFSPSPPLSPSSHLPVHSSLLCFTDILPVVCTWKGLATFLSHQNFGQVQLFLPVLDQGCVKQFSQMTEPKMRAQFCMIVL